MKNGISTQDFAWVELVECNTPDIYSVTLYTFMAKESGGKILSRREFIKGAALGTTAVGLAALGITYESLKVEASPENLRIGSPETGINGLKGGWGVLTGAEYNDLVENGKIRPGSGFIAEHIPSSEELPKEVSWLENAPIKGTYTYLGVEHNWVALMELYRTMMDIKHGSTVGDFWREGTANEEGPLSGARNLMYPAGMAGNPYYYSINGGIRSAIKYGYCSNVNSPTYDEITTIYSSPPYPTTDQIADAEANEKPIGWHSMHYLLARKPEDFLRLLAFQPGIMKFPVYDDRPRFIKEDGYFTLYTPEPGEMSPYQLPLLVIGYDEEKLLGKMMGNNPLLVHVPYPSYFDAVMQTHASLGFYFMDFEGLETGPTPTSIIPTFTPTPEPTSTSTPTPVDPNKVIFIPIALHAALGLQE